jgi:MFS family permease
MVASTEPEREAFEGDARYQRTLLFVVMLSVMGFGSLMTIVTVSLDDIAADLGSSRATLTWVITGLMLTMAVATPITGKLGDIRGHRRLFLLGLGGSAVTTALCALAWDAGSLIAFRVLFGLTGAMMMPSGMALMMHAYGADRRATAMGWYQFAMTGAPTVGLVLGGPLIEVVGWRLMFVVFAAVAVGALVVGAVLVRPIPRQHDASLDVLGAATLGVGVLAGLLAITRGTTLLRDDGWVAAVTDPVGWVLVVACVVGTTAFVRVERRAEAPMIRLEYFARRNFTLPMTASALLQFAYMGGFVVIPALLGQPYGWSVAAIALLLAPRPAAFSLAAPAGGYLAARIGEKKPIVLGLACMMASMAAFAGASATVSGVGIALIVAGLVLSGASAGISQPSVASMVVGSVDASDMGIANGMSQQVMFIGMVTGIQSMNVLVGDDAGTGQFVATFAFGLAIAGLGLLAALAIDER